MVTTDTPCVDGCGQDAATIERLREQLARVEADLVAGEASDGYHTHRELYDYRMLYNAHAAHGWVASGIPVVKSWRHSDGEECFGGGWFIVVATLPIGQVSNHYKAEHWGLFAVPEVDLPPEYDGHTPQDAADRLRAALTPQNHPRSAANAPEAPRQPGRGERGSGGHTGVVRVKIDNEDDLLPEYRTGYQFPYLDEFVANAVNIHFEAMGQSQFWIGITDPAAGRSWAINCGATNGRAKGYAFVEED